MKEVREAHPVEQGSYSPKLEQLVRLQALGELDRVVLVVRLETASQRDMVLLLDQQVVVRLVDDGDVELLRADKVRLDER